MYEVYNKRTKEVLRDDFKTMREANEYIDLEDDDEQKNLKIRQKTTPAERRNVKNWY